MKRIRRVLYATDFSEASRPAFAAAVSIAKSLAARLTILYVIPPVSTAVPELYLDAVTFDQLDKQARRWSAQQLEKLNARAKRAGVRYVAVSRWRRGGPDCARVSSDKGRPDRRWHAWPARTAQVLSRKRRGTRCRDGALPCRDGSREIAVRPSALFAFTRPMRHSAGAPERQWYSLPEGPCRPRCQTPTGRGLFARG